MCTWWAKELEPYLELAADGTPDAEDLTEIWHLLPAEGARLMSHLVTVVLDMGIL